MYTCTRLLGCESRPFTTIVGSVPLFSLGANLTRNAQYQVTESFLVTALFVMKRLASELSPWHWPGVLPSTSDQPPLQK